MATTLTRLTERAVLHGRVDREAGIVRGVRVLGPHSKNGRRYTQEAMRDAVSKYEGVRLYVNHPKKSEMDEDRPFGDWAGNLFNARFENGGIVADVKLRKESRHFAEICEAAESSDFSRSFGLSHEADGDSRYDRASGEEIIERIDTVRAVAIVSVPATTEGLFESDRPTGQDDIDLLLSDARKLKSTARPQIKAAFNTGDVSLLGDAQKDLASLALQLQNWINDPSRVIESRQLVADEARRLTQALADAMREPTRDGTPAYVLTMFNDLIALLERLSRGEEPELSAVSSEEIHESFRRMFSTPGGFAARYR